MEVLLGKEPRNVNVTVLLVEHLHPNQPLPGHYCLHESEVEAPDHDDSKDDGQRSHYNPVFNVVYAEDGSIDAVINAVVVFVLSARVLINLTLISITMVLLQKRIKQESALCEGDEQNEETDVSSNDSEQLRATQLLTLDIKVKVCSAFFAVDLLGPDHLCRDTICMMLLIFAVASLDVLGIDSQKLEVLTFVVEILLQRLEQW